MQKNSQKKLSEILANAKVDNFQLLRTRFVSSKTEKAVLEKLYPRFFSGLTLFGALVFAGTSVGLKFCSVFASFIDFAVANSFESCKIFNAAFAFLVNLFFSFAII